MAYQHGVYVSEQATSIVPAVNTTAGLPVVFGTAPIHLATDPAAANKPVLCYTYAEAVQQLGYSTDWASYTLCEVIYSQFALYGYSPVVFVNVLDPGKHIEAVENEELTVASGVATVSAPVLLDGLKVMTEADGDALTLGTDYTAAYDDDEVLNISVVNGGALDGVTTIYISYNKLDPTAVDADDIIGGVDSTTAANKGLECLDDVFTSFGLVPGIVLAPGWSDKPSVCAVMQSKASNINSHFKAVVLADVPTDEVVKYTDVPTWKDDNGYNGEDLAVCWPMAVMDDKHYHLSTHLLGALSSVDAANGDVPFESPSNKTASVNGLCLADGTEVTLGLDQANYLNGQGIITALNFMGGWKIWGNRTGCYPDNTDVKDSFLCVRRMFNWHASTFIQTYWAKVDKPVNKRLIQTIIDSENIRLNGLVADGALLGGRVEFIESENDTTNLLDGIIKFHTYLTPPVPARVIENVIEYDPSYFSELFS